MTAYTPLQTRWVLKAATTFYVDPVNGNDSNDGLSSSSGAFRTIQGAYNSIVNDFNFSGQTVTLQLADAIYTAGLNATIPNPGGGTLVINGNATTPSNVVINTTNNHAIIASGFGVNLLLQNFKLTTSGTGNPDCLIVGNGAAIVQITNLEFGTSAWMHMECLFGGQIIATGNYKISGNAVAHWHAPGGFINVSNITITLSGTPAFSSFFAGVAQGNITCFSDTFSGSATGPRFLAHNLGWINTNGAGATYLPGNSAGTTDSTTFGLYI